VDLVRLGFKLGVFDGTLGSEKLESVKRYFSGLLKNIDDYLLGNQAD
jgi:hypothetical protein